MMLLTKENKKQIPPMRSQENRKDPICFVKFFTPWTHWTWYVLEYDGQDTFFGYVQGLENELGYFSLEDLKSVNGPLGLKIERDRNFKPCPLSEIKAQER